MQALVVHGYSDVRELLTFILEAQFPLSVTGARDDSEALAACKVKNFDLVIADSQYLSAQQNHLLRELQSQACSVVVMSSQELSSEYKESHCYLLKKPFSEEDITRVSAIALGANQSDKDFFPVRLSLLKRLETIASPLYLRLSDGKYIKVAHEGSNFDQEQLQRFETKGAQHLYIDSRFVDSFLEKFSKNVLSKIAWDSTVEGAALDTFSLATETLWNLTQQLGWSESVVELTRIHLERALLLAKHLPAGQKLLQNFSRIERFGYADHCSLLLFLCIGASSELGIANEENIRTLTFASIFHDVMLTDLQYANKRRIIQRIHKKEGLTQKDTQDVVMHAPRAAELVSQWEFCPEGPEVIIRHHHSFPPETGFPDGQAANKFSQLSAIFVVCEDFVDCFIEARGSLGFKEYRELRRDYFKESPFAEVLACLKDHRN